MNTEESKETGYNQIGRIIGQERFRAGISSEQLCVGICSRSYLTRIEAGERGCEKIVSDALLQRLGVSQERFLYFLNTREQKWLSTREKLVTAVDFGLEKDYQSARKEYVRLTKGQSRLHEQFLMLAESVWDWKTQREADGGPIADWGSVAEKLRKAWNVTLPVWMLEESGPRRMSHMELSIKSLYVRILEESGRNREALDGYRKLFDYLGKEAFGRERAAFYVQIGYRILLLLEQNGSGTEDCEGIYVSCMEELKRLGVLFHLPELLKFRLGQLKKADEEGRVSYNTQQEAERVEELCFSLRWLYREYSVKPVEWIWYLTDDVEETYVLSDMIKGRRQAMGMTQEALAEDICDPVTISRIESGSVVPKQGVMAKLLEKLNIPSGSIVMSAQVGKPELHRTAEKFNLLIRFGKNEEALPLMEQMFKNAVRNRYVDQYLLSIETQTLYGAKKLEADSVQKRLWKALYMTVPEKPPENLTAWIFTRTEAGIINGISQSCEKVGQRDQGIAWLRLLQQYYEKLTPTMRKGIAHYELILRNLGSLLGNRQEYEEAIHIEDTAIRQALETNRGNVMSYILYDRVWNMEQLREQGKDDKEMRRCFMKAALALAYLFLKSRDICFLERHWEKYYAES